MNPVEIRLVVQGIVADPATDSHIVVLQDESKAHTLPIWVGMTEGNAIRFAVEGVQTPRPLTHDLFSQLLDRLKVSITKIVVSDLKHNTFYAKIYLEADGRPIEIDARPSDAIALSIRRGAPIFARQELLAASETERIQSWLENLTPADFEDKT